MHILGSIFMLAASLMPTKGWFTPSQAVEVQVKEAGADAQLALTNFTGGVLEAKGPADVAADKTINVKDIFPQVGTPGTYILYLKKKQGTLNEFLGTPLVIEVRENKKRGAPPGPMVVRVEPLRYMVMHTAKGDMTFAFYYDVAPNTASSFLTLGEQGYFDGIMFHRIVKGFVIQGGDPMSADPERAGTGGPGFSVDAEFSDRPHEAGALSMARNGDPGEASGMAPRPEYANSASSQFFVCIDYAKTKALDRKYTVFGKCVAGMDVVKAIEALPTDDKDRPKDPPAITKVDVKPVTAEDNPYAKLFAPKDAAAPAPPATPK